MGPVGHAVWAAWCLHNQFAAFHAANEQPILAESNFVSESGRVRAEPCHRDHAFCFSAILARRPPALDYWPGADGTGSRGLNQILPCQWRVALCYAGPNRSFVLFAAN